MSENLPALTSIVFGKTFLKNKVSLLKLSYVNVFVVAVGNPLLV